MLPPHSCIIVYTLVISHTVMFLRDGKILLTWRCCLIVSRCILLPLRQCLQTFLTFYYVKLTCFQCFTIVQLQMKKTFFVPDCLSECYTLFKQKFSSDFSSTSVSTIKLMIIQLRKWIKYIEDKSKYPARFVHHFRCPTIHQFDWSVIRIPSDHYIDVII